MKARVLTALALMPIVLGAFFAANPWPLTLLAAIAAFVGGREIARMLDRDSVLAGVISVVILLLPVILQVSFEEALPVAAALFVLGTLSAYFSSSKKGARFIPFALFWVAAPLSCILLSMPPQSTQDVFRFKLPILLAILPLWGGDTAAIFAGKAFGKHLLAPTISPKKTWEGTIANLLACVCVAWLLGPLLGASQAQSISAGVAAGTLGQAGDLFESYVKRQAGLKDSGNLLPGHGGLMDRIDSILFTAPAVALILWLVP